MYVQFRSSDRRGFTKAKEIYKVCGRCAHSLLLHWHQHLVIQMTRRNNKANALPVCLRGQHCVNRLQWEVFCRTLRSTKKVSSSVKRLTLNGEVLSSHFDRRTRYTGWDIFVVFQSFQANGYTVTLKYVKTKLFPIHTSKGRIFKHLRHNSVSVVTRLRAGRPGFNYRWRQWWNFLSSPPRLDRLRGSPDHFPQE
jgi:hypothetical protein